MRINFRPEASDEAVAAREWYESHTSGLGLEFERAVDAALAAVARNPAAYAKTEGECRRIILRRFPFTIFYRPEKAMILIVAVYHHSRKPGAWADRIGI